MPKITNTIVLALTGLLLWAAGSHTATAQNALALYPGGGPFSPVDYVLYFEDRSNQLGIGQARQAFLSGKFQPVSDDINFGNRDSTFWLRLEIYNPLETTSSWVVNLNSQRMRRAALFLIEPRTGTIDSRLLDDYRRSFHERPEPYRLLVSRISLQPFETAVAYIAYRSFGSSRVPLQIMTEPQFQQQDADQNAFLLPLFGAILALALSCSFIFLSLDYRHSVYYLLFALSSWLYHFHQLGYSYVYLWPDYPAFNSMFARLIGPFVWIWVALFFRAFFRSREHNPILDRVLRAMLVVSAGTVVLAPFPTVSHFAGAFGFFSATVCSAICLILTASAARRGESGAILVALGWIGITTALLGVLLSSLGVLPDKFIANTPNIYSLALLSVFNEVVFLTLAIAVRVRKLNRDHRAAQEKAIDVLRHELATSKALTEATEERFNAAEEAATKGKLLAAAAHDIRQPLHAIKLSARMLDERQCPEVQREARDNIAEAADLLDEITTTAFYSAESESSADILVPEVFPADQPLRSAALAFKAAAQERDLALRIRPSQLELFSDRAVVSRILNNLVSNAIKYTENGKILLACRRRGSNLAYQVWDTGAGIPESFIETVFDPFERGLQQDPATGFGFGLSIAKKLALSIDGELRLRSLEGTGTLAELYLPAGTGVGNVGRPLLNKLLWVIDDNAIARREAARQLRELGAATQEGESVTELLANANRAPDGLVCDYHLNATTNGILEAEKGREHYGEELPVVIITSDRMPELRSKVQASGFKLIYKPSHPKQFVAALAD